MRKQNLSIYDISRALRKEGKVLSAVSVSQILKEEGFARLPRRRDDQRPSVARPHTAAVANVRELDVSPRKFRTKFGGLFLFMPYRTSVGFDKIIKKARLPGSTMVPAAYAIRSLLALKLFGNARLESASSTTLHVP